jgi:NADPH:quinone reductase-like Zn-dependent oxidoreductase
LGGGVQGTLAEYIALPEHALVSIPDSLSYEEAATLPCAAVTAWNGLTADPNLKAGDTLLLLGTGGVSIFGLQLGKAMGLRTIITSSSDDKLAKAKALGADATVNYKNHPEWHEQVLELTDGHGVDHVLEVGGPGTLERSIKSTRVGGTISMIGLLDVPEQQPSMLPLLMNAITVRGIYVGSVEIFESLLRTIEVNKIKPVIDRSFPFDDAHAAYEYFMGKGYLGKVVISHE